MAVKKQDVRILPPDAEIISDDVSIGFGVDLERRMVLMQFDQHLRCVGLSEEETIELITALSKALTHLGVVVTRDDPDQRH